MRTEPWFDDPVALYRFERDGRASFGPLQRRIERSPADFAAIATIPVPRVVYELRVDVPVFDDPRAITINVPADTRVPPVVFADGAADSPHRNSDGSVCCYFLADPEEQRWVYRDGLAKLVDRVRTHLWQEETLRRAGRWIGPEAPHGMPR